jgi:hypothetical protein
MPPASACCSRSTPAGQAAVFHRKLWLLWRQRGHPVAVMDGNAQARIRGGLFSLLAIAP